MLQNSATVTGSSLIPRLSLFLLVPEPTIESIDIFSFSLYKEYLSWSFLGCDKFNLGRFLKSVDIIFTAVNSDQSWSDQSKAQILLPNQNHPERRSSTNIPEFYMYCTVTNTAACAYILCVFIWPIISPLHSEQTYTKYTYQQHWSHISGQNKNEHWFLSGTENHYVVACTYRFICNRNT